MPNPKIAPDNTIAPKPIDIGMPCYWCGKDVMWPRSYHAACQQPLESFLLEEKPVDADN